MATADLDHRASRSLAALLRRPELKPADAGGDADAAARGATPSPPELDTAGRRLWRRSASWYRYLAEVPSRWPLTARLPLIAGALILAVGIAISQIALVWYTRQQQAALEQLSAVYLDGLSASVFPHVVARDRDMIAQALRRAMLFDQGIRERRLIVRAPDEAELASVAIAARPPTGNLTPAIREQLLDRGGVVVDEASSTGWAYRALIDGGKLIARIYVALDLTKFEEQRRSFRVTLALFAFASSVICAALGFLLIGRMLAPLHSLANRLKRAEAGQLAPVPETELGAPTTEFGRLLRGFNSMVRSVHDREMLATRLAQEDKMTTLGRLAATLAHEVRNPLGGMFNALDTVHKYGADPAVRSQGLRIIERGLASIRDVVTATLATYRTPIEPRRLSPEDLDDIRLLIEPEARRRRLLVEWSNEIAGELPLDATKVRQIALNLLLNACAASPPGSLVTFEAAARSGLRLLIVDSGPGLPAEIGEMLQAKGAGEQRPPADGLGLWVVVRLVEEMRGEITVARAETGGTRIVVSLPIEGR